MVELHSTSTGGVDLPQQLWFRVHFGSAELQLKNC
jgi:hypothetical protein